MLNIQYLDEWITKSGKKKDYLAEKLGITRQCFYRKCKGESDFSAKEIKILCYELGITRLADKEAIFFAN